MTGRAPAGADRLSRFLRPPGKRVARRHQGDRDEQAGQVSQRPFRPDQGGVEATGEEMRECRSGLHPEHFLVQGAQTCGVLDMLDRTLRFTAENAQEPPRNQAGAKLGLRAVPGR